MYKKITAILPAVLLPVLLGLVPHFGTAQVLRGTFAAAIYHSLSIHADGTLWVTGFDREGQLGDSLQGDPRGWRQMGRRRDWVQVAAGGAHSLGLRADGTLWAWGSNSGGQLGVALEFTPGYDHLSRVAVQVPGTYVQIAAAGANSAALRADGTLWVWGSNERGQLGYDPHQPPYTADATRYSCPEPMQVPGTYTQVVVGGAFFLALQADGSAWAWGDNEYGQLGFGLNRESPGYSMVPRQLPGTYTQVAAGLGYSLLLAQGGRLWACGMNYSGQLGHDSLVGFQPRLKEVWGRYTQIAAGAAHSLALQADGSLWAWGRNGSGELGDNAAYGTMVTTALPVRVAGTYVHIVAGYEYSLGLRADGTLWTWGQNNFGQQGRGVGGQWPTPATAANAHALVTRSAAAGADFGLAIRGDGTLWAWGSNAFHQLGDSTTSSRLLPAQVGTDRDWVQVAAGEYHALALKASGRLYAWGDNTRGQLGTGSREAAATPTPVAGEQLFVEVAAGAAHSIARTDRGDLYAWGANDRGQLGQGDTEPALVPTNKGWPGRYISFVQLAAGRQHSLGRTATGAVFAWGSNAYGQLAPAWWTTPRYGNFTTTTSFPSRAFSWLLMRRLPPRLRWCQACRR